MAGHMVYYYLREMGGYDLANVVYRTPLTGDSLIVDVSDRNAVEEAVRQVKPDILINCVGVLVRGSKEHPDNAVLLNAYFPHLLEKLADRYDARLIHISTDCVFSGKKGNYSETDFRDADDVYGRSKALGEIVNGRDLTIRTSIIGPELKADGEGLFHWLMSQHGTVSGFKTAIWGGVTTLELAKAISVAIKEGTTGLVHLSNGTGISKYDLLCLFKDIWGRKDVEIVSVDTNDVDKSIAKSARFGYEVPGYREMLKDLYAWMQAHKDMYRQYWER
ncbi:dTDP-4-dehydrorhamnose reductase family protein [Alistipes ihumii]|uniref:dTDP-4-dehydrorhamnose reductase n=2 Tax=Alistipes ihumii TaxID=1470347 RepID=A0ABY5UY32_9BACT|nr:SDR family oxidoreductase [Alistipes ihumii]UWN56538.1 SDR family oxidoreductase [Alistipes ihumii AP11]